MRGHDYLVPAKPEQLVRVNAGLLRGKVSGFSPELDEAEVGLNHAALAQAHLLPYQEVMVGFGGTDGTPLTFRKAYLIVPLLPPQQPKMPADMKGFKSQLIAYALSYSGVVLSTEGEEFPGAEVGRRIHLNALVDEARWGLGSTFVSSFNHSS